MNNLSQFSKKSAYELRSDNYLQKNVQITHFGNKFIKTLRAKIWNLIPEETKALKFVSILKKS